MHELPSVVEVCLARACDWQLTTTTLKFIRAFKDASIGFLIDTDID